MAALPGGAGRRPVVVEAREAAGLPPAALPRLEPMRRTAPARPRPTGGDPHYHPHPPLACSDDRP